MEYGLFCTECMVARQVSLARKQGDTKRGMAFMMDVLHAIETAPKGVSSPYMTAIFEDLARQHFGLPADLLAEEKKISNAYMLSRLDWLRQQVAEAEEPLYTALCFGRMANYIDFSALRGQVDYQQLDNLLAKAPQEIIDREEYERFCTEAAAAQRMVYLCDNAGEIVADRVVGEALKQRFPHLQLTYVVRGSAASNDALMADALEVGLDQIGTVMDNGTAIPGTELPYISQALQEVLDRADLILAKGMGNFETLWGCGKNIYYLFLCKCKRFENMFGVPALTGMFINERRLHLQEYVD